MTAAVRPTSDTDVPSWLGRLQIALAPGDEVRVRVPFLQGPRLDDVVTGAGFSLVGRPSRDHTLLRRERTLPDAVDGAMHLLLVSLNPSFHSADAGVDFARAGNRFWPAMLTSGLATVDRDQWHLLVHHRIGLTELVKRATARAEELDVEEYREGMARVERLVAWLAPSRVCFVGLDGWRKVVDRKAITGWQARRVADVPTYVMPNTSGLNARSTVATLAADLLAAHGEVPARRSSDQP